MSITDNQLPENQREVAYNLLTILGSRKEKSRSFSQSVVWWGTATGGKTARALATNVDIILADEPTGNLDEENGTRKSSIFLKDLAHMHNKCVIVVTHANEIAQQARRSTLFA